MEKTQTKKNNVISRDVAEKELIEWLTNVRRIREITLENLDADAKQAYQNTILNIMDGTISIKSDGKIVQRLFFPIGEDIGNNDPITELVMNARIKFEDLDGGKKAKNASDEAKTKFILSNLTGIQHSLIGKMNSGDIQIAGDIIVFHFLQ